MRLCAQPEQLYVDQTNFTKNPIFLTSIFLTSNNALGTGLLDVSSRAGPSVA
jgi:hypothetical protein